MRVPMRVANRVLTQGQLPMRTQRTKATQLVQLVQRMQRMQRMQRTVKRALRRVPAPLALVSAH